MENTTPPSKSEDIPSHVTEALAIACAGILELVDRDPANLSGCMDTAYGFMVLLNFSELPIPMPIVDLKEYLYYVEDIQKPQPDKQQREYELRMRDSFRRTVQDYVDTYLPENENSSRHKESN